MAEHIEESSASEGWFCADAWTILSICGTAVVTILAYRRVCGHTHRENRWRICRIFRSLWGNAVRGITRCRTRVVTYFSVCNEQQEEQDEGTQDEEEQSLIDSQPDITYYYPKWNGNEWNERKYYKQPTGANNSGNSCYMNSALQFMLAARPFMFTLCEDVVETKRKDSHSFNIEFVKLVNNLTRRKHDVSAQSFRRIAGKGHPEFSGYGQQDALEYFLHLMVNIEDHFPEDLKHLNPSHKLRVELCEEICRGENCSHVRREEYVISCPLAAPQGQQQQNDPDLSSTDKEDSLKSSQDGDNVPTNSKIQAHHTEAPDEESVASMISVPGTDEAMDATTRASTCDKMTDVSLPPSNPGDGHDESSPSSSPGTDLDASALPSTPDKCIDGSALLANPGGADPAHALSSTHQGHGTSGTLSTVGEDHDASGLTTDADTDVSVTHDAPASYSPSKGDCGEGQSTSDLLSTPGGVTDVSNLSSPPGTNPDDCVQPITHSECRNDSVLPSAHGENPNDSVKDKDTVLFGHSTEVDNIGLDDSALPERPTDAANFDSSAMDIDVAKNGDDPKETLSTANEKDLKKVDAQNPCDTVNSSSVHTHRDENDNDGTTKGVSPVSSTVDDDSDGTSPQTQSDNDLPMEVDRDITMDDRMEVEETQPECLSNLPTTAIKSRNETHPTEDTVEQTNITIQNHDDITSDEENAVRVMPPDSAEADTSIIPTHTGNQISEELHIEPSNQHLEEDGAEKNTSHDARQGRDLSETSTAEQSSRNIEASQLTAPSEEKLSEVVVKENVKQDGLTYDDDDPDKKQPFSDSSPRPCLDARSDASIDTTVRIQTKNDQYDAGAKRKTMAPTLKPRQRYGDYKETFNLDDCIRKFMAKDEVLTTGTERITKMSRIASLPEYLVIQPRIFVLNKWGRPEKQHVKIEAPDELNMREWLCDENGLQEISVNLLGTNRENTDYRLKAFVTHYGSTPQGGHYICHVKHGGTWYKYDDSWVSETANPPKQDGYFYLYERLDVQQEFESGA